MELSKEELAMLIDMIETEEAEYGISKETGDLLVRLTIELKKDW
jgi:hypothetical protein